VIDSAPAVGAALQQLAEVLGHFESRPGQVAMAQAVAQALDQQTDLLVEAGTGTGKTLAYLVPILCGHKRALLSTATRHLQTQLVQSDIPLALRATGLERTVAVLKGRSNYLCLHRTGLLRTAGAKSPFQKMELQAIDDALRRSEDGDRASVHGIEEQSAIWPEVTSTADNCLGTSCPRYEECFVVLARRRATAADLVVVNHAQLLADYAVRERWQLAGLLPSVDAVVLDEAHALADIATGFFGSTLSERRLLGVCKDARSLLIGVPGPSLARDLGTAIDGLADAAAWQTAALRALPHLTLVQTAARVRLQATAKALEHALGEVQDLASHPDLAAEPDWQKLGETLYALRTDLHRLLFEDVGEEPEHLVCWVEHRTRDIALVGRPLDVGPILRRTLLAESAVRIFTSATLTSQGRFDHVRQRLGLAADIPSLALPGGFDYPRQALLYVPADVPEPFAEGREAAVARHIEQLATAASGGTFALFSSHRALRDALERLRPLLAMTCLGQGEQSKEHLLERFVREQPAVLFATMGFWQGVDLPQDTLRVVILDKIPFPPPDDPLLVARSRRIEQEGGSPFSELSIPVATIALRQGFGRLVRSRRHWGIVAVLDPRLCTKSYGRAMLQSLPPAPLVRDVGSVRSFLLDRMNG